MEEKENQTGENVEIVKSFPPDVISPKVMVFIIATAILTLITVGAVSYMLSSSRKKPTSITYPTSAVEQITSSPIQETPTQVPVISQKLLPTATLTPTPYLKNSYNNSTYGYSFRYPSGWTLVNTSSSDPKILNFLVLNPQNATNSALTITVSYTTRTYDEALALNKEAPETVFVNGISSSRKIYKDSMGNISVQVIVPSKNNTRTFIFVAREVYKSTLDQMLPTFKGS